VAGIETVTQSS